MGKCVLGIVRIWISLPGRVRAQRGSVPGRREAGLTKIGTALDFDLHNIANEAHSVVGDVFRGRIHRDATDLDVKYDIVPRGRGFLGRQTKSESCALAYLCLRPDPAAVALDDPPYQ